MQYSQTCQGKSARRPKKIRLGTESDEKFIFYKKKFLKRFIWTIGLQFWQPCFWQKIEPFQFILQKRQKNGKFNVKRPSKCSPGNVECSLDNTVRENLTKDQNVLLLVQKCWSNAFFQIIQKQINLLKMFLWSRWLRFGQPCATISKKSRVVSAQGP